MAKHRELPDRILSLMALYPFPIGVNEIAEQLEVTTWLTHEALKKLHEDVLVVRTQADSSGGRPAYLWTLPNTKPISPELLALARQFPIDTVVVTPSDREAKILAIGADGRAALMYLDGDPEGPPIKLSLLKAFQPGRARPQPVRIKN